MSFSKKTVCRSEALTLMNLRAFGRGTQSSIRKLTGRALTVLACASLVACTDDGNEEQSGIKVGLLLPFTGSSSATAANLERAAIYAADRINDSGGVRGQTLRVVSRDTHSSIARSRESAQELIDAGASVIVGPESAEIAESIKPWLAERNVVFVSPLVGASDEPGKDCEPWVRLAPSARALGEALAKQVIGKGETEIAILYSSGAYDQALRTAVSARFREERGNIVHEIQLDPSAQSYAREVKLALDTKVSALVLATSPRAGALFVNEYHALRGKTPQWFLSPLLKTELFVQNVAPTALEGAMGIAPNIEAKYGAPFTSAFASRWLGDIPLEGAYFYYDAMALIATGMEKSTIDPEAGDQTSYHALQKAIFDAAQAPGSGLGWDELELLIERQRDGEDMYYTGLTGPLLLSTCGSRRKGVTSEWSVHAGAVEAD